MVKAANGNKKSKSKYGGPGGAQTGNTYSNKYGGPGGAKSGSTNSNKYGGPGGAQSGNTYKPGTTATGTPNTVNTLSNAGSKQKGSSLADVLNPVMRSVTKGVNQASEIAKAAQAKQKSDAPEALTWQDYLNQALGMGGSSSNTDVSNQLSALSGQEGATRQAANDADGKLAAMYAQLKGSFDADGGKIADQYNATRDQQSAASDDAAGAVKEGYQASTNELTDMLTKLGIGDAAKVAANQGDTLQGDQAAALSGISSNKAASLNNTSAKSASAQDYNREIGQAAQMEGTTQRAVNQQNLAKSISAIAASRSQLEDQAASSSSSGPSLSDAIAYANAASKSDSSSADNTAKKKQQKFENDLALQNAAAAQNKNGASAANSTASVVATLMKAGMNQQQALQLLKSLNK